MTKEQLRSIPITVDEDIVTARQIGREMAAELGFRSTEVALIVTAISELARNIVLYAGTGEIVVKRVNNSTTTGIRVIASDEGPGIEDLNAAMAYGYSTSGNMGMGLPGVRRVMDEFHINGEPGKGTQVSVTKWTSKS